MIERFTFAGIYNEIPEVDNEDREFMLDLFADAVKRCEERKQPQTLKNIFSQAQRILIQMGAAEYRQHYSLMVSITEPSIQIFRWFPPIAEKLGIEIDFKPLWEYVEPNVTMALNIHLWNRACAIIEGVPEFAQTLKTKVKKPQMMLLDYGDERGLVAAIIDDETKLVIKGTVGPDEERIARKVAGIVGPSVVYSNQNWIVEELLDGIPVENFIHTQPEIVGAVLGVTLGKTHNLDLAYLDRFDRGHVLIDPQTLKVSLIDWSSAEEFGDKSQDLKNVVRTIRTWYDSDNESIVKALKSFKAAYIKNLETRTLIQV